MVNSYENYHCISTYMNIYCFTILTMGVLVTSMRREEKEWLRGVCVCAACTYVVQGYVQLGVRTVRHCIFSTLKSFVFQKPKVGQKAKSGSAPPARDWRVAERAARGREDDDDVLTCAPKLRIRKILSFRIKLKINKLMPAGIKEVMPEVDKVRGSKGLRRIRRHIRRHSYSPWIF